MDDKIKITLPKNVLDLLKKDCVDFNVVKNNGAPNFNAFINTLIANFCDEFCASEDSLHNQIKGAIDAVPERYKDVVFVNVLKVISSRADFSDSDGVSTTFSFKPTKASQNERFFIESAMLASQSLSSFYRRMFVAYARKTKNLREKIIFKGNYDLLQKAVRNGVRVCLRLKNEAFANVSVHSVHSAKDELFNYVLIFDGKRNSTLRLANVLNVTLLSTPSCIPDENVELFERQIRCGVQYPMYNTDCEPIKVKMTEKGKKLFEKIYLYRPTPVSIDGDIYTFDCSANQLLYYFERFGENALILQPKRLGIFMRNYYYYALKKYRTVYRAD